MSARRRRPIPAGPMGALGLGLLVLVATGCAQGPDADPSARPRGGAVTAPRPPDRVAQIREQHLLNIELTTHEGRRVRFYDDLVKGRVVAINFMFTMCGSGCPVTTANLVQVQKALRAHVDQDVTFLSITLDPENDTLGVLRRYAADFGVGPGWYLVRGARDDVERLRRALGAYDPDPRVDADLRQHVGVVILGNEPAGRWKAISALSKPVRIRQAIERTILPPHRWPTGQAVVDEAPHEERDAAEPADLSALPALD